MSKEDELPIKKLENPVGKQQYLFELFETARRIVVPGRTGEHMFMFKAKAGVYLIDSFYFIEIQDIKIRTAEIDPYGNPVEELGKLIVVTTMSNEIKVRAYMIRQRDFPKNPLDDMTFYFDGATAQVFHRYTRTKTKVYDEKGKFLEEEMVCEKGVELDKYPIEKLKKDEDIIYPEYV